MKKEELKKEEVEEQAKYIEKVAAKVPIIPMPVYNNSGKQTPVKEEAKKDDTKKESK